jgi:putative ABC transport system permease protein
MTGIRVLISRVLDLLLSGRRERRLDEEISDHLDLLAEQYLADGMTPSQARQAARRAFGGVEQMKESYRDQRGLPLVDALRQDLRFALRLLHRNRGFALTAVLVLGAGIGVNNMLFTILNAHTLRGLPIPSSDRVVWLSTIDDRGRDRGVSFADYRDITAGVQHYAGIAAFDAGPMVLAGDGRAAERLDGAYVTANAFDLIGTRPLLGRSLAAADDTPGAPGVGVLSRTAWETRYGADPGILGRAVTLNGVPVTLIGVLPDRSGFPGTAQVWTPLSQSPGLAARTRDARTLQVFGRVADGTRVDEAIAEVIGIGDRLASEHPDTNRNTRARVVPINDRFLGRATDGVWRAFITVGFIVVLISCANVANLMLDRSLLRARELAIRASVGGSRTRLLRQLLVEGAVIATFGAGVGLLVAIGGIRVFRRAIPSDALPYWFDYSIDWRVLAALIGVSAGTVLVSALVPAIQASRTDVLTVLKEGGRPRGSGRRRILATMFLVAQLALAVVLLAHLAVNVRVHRPGLASDTIFDDAGIVTAVITLSAASYPTAVARSAFYDSLLTRLHQSVSLDSAAVASTLPASGGDSRELVIDGKRGPDQDAERTVLAIAITPAYFRALGLSLLQGRDLDDSDGSPGRENVIVNQAFADTFLAGESVVGRRIRLVSSEAPSEGTGWLAIVGVAPDIRQRRGRDSDPVVYTPFPPNSPASAALILRSPLDTAAVVSALRQQVQSLDPALPIYRARTLAQVRRDLDWNGRVSNGLFLFLAFIAVALATFGLYAVTTHAVSRERHDIGIRMALGARSHQIIARVLRRLLVQVFAGFAAGVVLTALWERTFPPGDANIHATDPVSLTLVALALLGLIMIAAAVPSRRASRVDPLLAIRAE